MKTGVVTIMNGANYGNRLQNYAIVETLKKVGCNPENVKNQSAIRLGFKHKIVALVANAFHINRYIYLLRRASFDKFNNKYMTFSNVTYRQIGFNCQEYDAFVCGSDQIWNPVYESENKEYYFARFVPKEKRIAFSASIGIDEIPDEHKEWFAEYVNDFEHISVREHQGAKIIKDLTGRDVPVTIDPTLMLSKKEWFAVAKKPSVVKKNQKFILAYFLGDFNQDIRGYINRVAKQNDCKVIDLQDFFIDKQFIVNETFKINPAEFVWLVANSEMFFTDSYHGCVFATIFKKSFRWFSRSTNTISRNMNSRMETLFGKLQLGDWCIGNVNEPIEKIFDCDFSSVDENLAKEQRFAYEYLKGALK